MGLFLSFRIKYVCFGKDCVCDLSYKNIGGPICRRAPKHGQVVMFFHVPWHVSTGYVIVGEIIGFASVVVRCCLLGLVGGNGIQCHRYSSTYVAVSFPLMFYFYCIP